MSLRFLYNHTSNRIYTVMQFYALVKSQETPLFVIPANPPEADKSRNPGISRSSAPRRPCLVDSREPG
jgi:hypothetical protein